MRISDWSADVCSSDLRRSRTPDGRQAQPAAGSHNPRCPGAAAMTEEPNAATIAAATSAPKASPPDLRLRPPLPTVMRLSRKTVGIASAVTLAAIGGAFGYALYDKGLAAPAELLVADRSEEHTSELQSLMRTSYA